MALCQTPLKLVTDEVFKASDSFLDQALIKTIKMDYLGPNKQIQTKSKQFKMSKYK